MRFAPTLALAVSLSPVIAVATGEYTTTGAANNAMGGSRSMVVNVFSAINNQAALGMLEGFQAGAFAEQRFAGLGIGRYAAAMTLATATGTFGMTAGYFGYELYRDTRLGLAFGRSIGQRFNAGFQVNYVGTHISEYGSAATFNIELGLLARLSPKWTLGAHAYNPTQSTIGETDEPLPSVLTLGVAYQSSEKLLMVAEVEKDINFAPNFRSGLQYELIQGVEVRGGFATNPALLTFGIGFHLNNLRIDMASTVHTILGVSPQVSLIYEVGRK